METNPISSGVQTFLNANQKIQDSAAQIAKSSENDSSTDLVAPLIELKEAEQQAKAALKIIEAENSQVATLLDVLA